MKYSPENPSVRKTPRGLVRAGYDDASGRSTTLWPKFSSRLTKRFVSRFDRDGRSSRRQDPRTSGRTKAAWTIALSVAAKALELQIGDEILVPAYGVIR